MAREQVGWPAHLLDCLLHEADAVPGPHLPHLPKLGGGDGGGAHKAAQGGAINHERHRHVAWGRQERQGSSAGSAVVSQHCPNATFHGTYLALFFLHANANKNRRTKGLEMCWSGTKAELVDVVHTV